MDELRCLQLTAEAWRALCVIDDMAGDAIVVLDNRPRQYRMVTRKRLANLRAHTRYLCSKRLCIRGEFREVVEHVVRHNLSYATLRAAFRCCGLRIRAYIAYYYLVRALDEVMQLSDGQFSLRICSFVSDQVRITRKLPAEHKRHADACSALVDDILFGRRPSDVVRPPIRFVDRGPQVHYEPSVNDS